MTHIGAAELFAVYSSKIHEARESVSNLGGKTMLCFCVTLGR